MRFLTEEDLRARCGLGRGGEIRLGRDERLTPAAQGLVNERRIRVLYLDDIGRVGALDAAGEIKRLPVLRTVNEYVMASPGVGVPEPSSSTIAPCAFVSVRALTSGGSPESDRLSVASSVSVTVRSPATYRAEAVAVFVCPAASTTG